MSSSVVCRIAEAVLIGFLPHEAVDRLFARANGRRVAAGPLENVWLDETALRKHLRWHADGDERERFWDEVKPFLSHAFNTPVGYWPYRVRADKISAVFRLPKGYSHDYAVVGLQRTTEVCGRRLPCREWVVTTIIPCTGTDFRRWYGKRFCVQADARVHELVAG